MSSPRVRFAPSPTGYFHVGGARTALFNWLFVRQQGGEFVLRIEDTDEERNKPEWVEGIFASMQWIGLNWDDEPVFQSAATDRHVDVAKSLAAEGRAYYCECTRDDVDARATASGGDARRGYDGFCRDRALPSGEGRALRFKTPREGATTVRDVIRGDVEFEHANLEDFVLLRATGKPMFVLANAIDDVDMRISHVIRGEEHLPNTPKALLVMEAMGVDDPPVWAHVPVLVNEKRQKLSKRRDKVDMAEYAREGYLPEAMRNYLALLGWAPGDDREILTLDELLAEFRLDQVNNSPAYFDLVKLASFNQAYLKDVLSVEQFTAEALQWMERRDGAAPVDADAFARIAPVLPSRVKTLAEVPAMVDFLFTDEIAVDDAAWEKDVVKREWSPALLDAVIGAFETCPWEVDALHAAVLAAGEAQGVGLSKAQAPVRIAVTGRKVGPPLFESLEVLGRERSLARLRAGRARLA